jgi:hypothetical protein
MKIASYHMEGNGPDPTDVFSIDTVEENPSVAHLSMGRWDITVQALNEEGKILSQGKATTIVKGKITEMEVELNTFPGTGSLSASFSWKPLSTDIPDFSLILTAVDGTRIKDLSPACKNSICGTATVNVDKLAAGSYLLHAKLEDNGICISTSVVPVRIIEGTQSSCPGIKMFIGNPSEQFTVRSSINNLMPLNGTLMYFPIRPKKGENVNLEFMPEPFGNTISTTAFTYSWYHEGKLLMQGKENCCTITPEPGTQRYDVIVTVQGIGCIGAATFLVSQPFPH